VEALRVGKRGAGAGFMERGAGRIRRRSRAVVTAQQPSGTRSTGQWGRGIQCGLSGSSVRMPLARAGPRTARAHNTQAPVHTSKNAVPTPAHTNTPYVQRTSCTRAAWLGSILLLAFFSTHSRHRFAVLRSSWILGFALGCSGSSGCSRSWCAQRHRLAPGLPAEAIQVLQSSRCRFQSTPLACHALSD
jgi:hypothetical protein